MSETATIRVRRVVETNRESGSEQRLKRGNRSSPAPGLIAATAAIGGSLGLPMMRAEEKLRELTKHDHDRLREAELKRQRRAAKKAENQRRANEGKRALGAPMTTEIVYTWPDGRQEVRYRRSYDSAEALQLIGEVCDLQVKHGAACPYSYRHVA